MNIVKLQNDLKDLSDQQLLSSMQMGSAPQYLVLAEMQRRKKMRDEASTQAPQNEGTVADEIMGGITQLPMQAPQMASGGLVSFATGGYAKGEAEACWTNPETGEKMCPPSKPDVRYPTTKGGSSASKAKLAGGGIVALQAGGTPSQARAMLAGMGVDTTGLSDEKVMELLAAKNSNGVVESAGDSATGFGFIGADTDFSVNEPGEMVGPGEDASYLARPLNPSEVLARDPQNAAEYMESLQVTENLGKDLAQIAKDMGDPEIQPSVEYRQGPKYGETELDQEILRRMGGIKALQPQATSEYMDLLGMAKELHDEAVATYATDPARAEKLEIESRRLVQSAMKTGEFEQLERLKPGQVIADYAKEGTPGPFEREETKAGRLPYLAKAQRMYGELQAAPESTSRTAALANISDYMENSAGKDLSERVWTGIKGLFSDPNREARIAAEQEAEAAAEAERKAAKTAKAQAEAEAKAAGDKRTAELEAQTEKGAKDAATKESEETEDKYLDYLRRRYEDTSKDNSFNEALMRAGLAMMANKSSSFLGALGEGGIEGLKSYQASRKSEEAARQKILEEEGAYRRAQIAAEAMSPYRAASAAVDKSKQLAEMIEDLKDPIKLIQKKEMLKSSGQYKTDAEINAAIQAEIQYLEQQRRALLGIMSMQQGVGLNMQSGLATQGASGKFLGFE